MAGPMISYRVISKERASVSCQTGQNPVLAVLSEPVRIDLFWILKAISCDFGLKSNYAHPSDNSVLMVDVFARFYYSPSTTDPLPALTPSDD